mgnify:CR=1 FL=1
MKTNTNIEIQNALLTNQRRKILNHELQELTQSERKALCMRYWGPCSIAQIATELRVSWEVADKLIDRAIEKLRDGFIVGGEICKE